MHGGYRMPLLVGRGPTERVVVCCDCRKGFERDREVEENVPMGNKAYDYSPRCGWDPEP